MYPWYEQIGREAKGSAVLHADETGWRVDGQTWWLWCFANQRNCYYQIDKSRGSPALQRFFTEAFGGTLVSDFWRAYESVVVEDRQYCLPHLHPLMYATAAAFGAYFVWGGERHKCGCHLPTFSLRQSG